MSDTGAVKSILLVMKELGLTELTIHAATIVGIDSSEVLEVTSHQDGSMTLRRPAARSDIGSCPFSDIKARLIPWLKARSGTFTLNQVLAEVFGKNPETSSHSERERIGQALAQLGWTRTARYKDDQGKRAFVYGQKDKIR